MSRLARQAVVLSVARILNYGLMLLSPVILVRILSVNEFGLYREFLVYASLLMAFAAFNINDSLLYFIPAHPQSRWRIIDQTTRLVGISSFIIVTVVVLLDLLSQGRLIGTFLLPMAVYVLLFVNIDFWEWYWLASHRPAAVFLYTAGRLLARMLVVVTAAAFTHDVHVIVWSLIGLETLRILVSAIAWRRARNPAEPPPATDLWREQLRFCMPWGVAVIFAMGSRNLGNIAVVKLLGAVPLAHYTIGLYGEPIVVAVRNAISSVLLPEMVRRGAESQAAQMAIWRRVTIINCLTMLPMAVLVVRYAAPLVTAVFGEAYAPAIVVLQIYAFVMVRECFDLTLPLRAGNNTAPLVRSSLVGLIANAVCVVFLVQRFGIAGAVVALLVGTVAEAVYLNWQVAKLTGIRCTELIPWKGFATVAFAALLASVVTWSDLWRVHLGWGGICIAALLYLGLFAALIRLLRVPEADMLRELANKVLDKVRSRPTGTAT